MASPSDYLALCLDPVHIGTGGYRLGRVDMSIVRDPATGIPQIPGTSLAGAIRAYAEQAREEDDSLPEINFVFGSIEGQARQGMLRFYDAEIALFPVSSHLGTVWVSTLTRLQQWLGVPHGTRSDPQDEHKVIAIKGIAATRPVHLGWLLLETEERPAGADRIKLPDGLSFVQRVVAVSDKLFYHLVNDHLEVRTSVEIDDETGAAKEGHLFTYEAIPRGTIIGFQLQIDGRRANGVSATQIEALLNRAFNYLELLGIGGMVTRGFGRLRVLPHSISPAAVGGDA